MTYGSRFSRSAYILNENDQISKLHRVPLLQGSFNETWLQSLLEREPSIIPSREVSPLFHPLVFLGREVPVGTENSFGYIDNLYITPSGHLVVVETKLFRNSESHRKVIAQILDYAKELQKWDCSKLDDFVSNYTYKKYGKAYNTFDLMLKDGLLRQEDEAEFADAVNDNLKRASFLLLIVGDGIRSGVEQLANFLNEHTSMDFHLGLVEIEVYYQDNQTIIIPNLITKTTIIERILYRDKKGYLPAPIVKPEKYVQKPILTQQEFINIFAEQGGYEVDEIMDFIGNAELIPNIGISITPTELRICIDTGSRMCKVLYFMISDNKGTVMVVPSETKSDLSKVGRYRHEFQNFLDFYEEYIDVNKTKYKPYEKEGGFYYANVDKILRDKNLFLKELEKLSQVIME